MDPLPAIGEKYINKNVSFSFNFLFMYVFTYHITVRNLIILVTGKGDKKVPAYLPSFIFFSLLREKD